MMKRLLTVAVVTMAVCLGFLATGYAQQQGELVKPTSAAEARKLVGTNAVVGVVAEVNRTDKLVRLNFGQKYPKQDFTAVVFAKNFGAFTNLDTLEGKTVQVSGKVSEYKGRTEMILTTKGQLQVVDSAKTAPVPK